jgi:2-methylisocitrate lyase-like PEP mutase family enzyme
MDIMRPMTKQSEKAELLRRLHHGPDVLVLPNAWDCASARIFERAGFPAIASTSAGLANSLGYPDGQRIPREEMLAAVKRIAACVGVPVTADLEAGYEDIAKTTAGLVDSGAVGLNLEDLDYGGTGGLLEIGKQVEKIAAVRRIGDELGVKLVINARTDVYLAQIGDAESRFGRTCDRLRAYIEAGADCVFIPGVRDEDLIGRLVQVLKFPINILAVAGTPPVQRLKELGVARVTVGSGIMRATMGLTRQIAQELRTRGTYNKMVEGTIPYAEANSLFES